LAREGVLERYCTCKDVWDRILCGWCRHRARSQVLLVRQALRV